MTNKIIRMLPLIGWALAILVLSLASDPPSLEISLASWDKFQHAAAYALLTFLAGIAFRPFCRRPATAWRLALAFAILYGALLEVAQSAFTSVRLAEWGDLVADAVGALAVYFVARLRLKPVRSGE